MHVPLTPLHFKQRAEQLFGRKVGVVDGDRRLTYAEFGERTNRLAQALLDAGLGRGDRVAVLAFNGHPLLEAYFGVVQAGGILLPLNLRLAPAELARILGHAGAKWLLVDGQLASVVAQMQGALDEPLRIVWIGERPAGRTEERYEALLASASSAAPPALELDENDVAELFYTSGTTAEPRGVMLTHRSLTLCALSILIAFRASERDVQLHTIPLFHVNGWGTPHAITGVGGTHVMMQRFDAAEALRLVEAERVTRLFAVPTMLLRLVEQAAFHRHDLDSLELVNVGGGALSAELVRRAEDALGCQVIGGYGLTETSPTVSLAFDKSYLSADEPSRLGRQATAGLPLLGVEMDVVDPTGRRQPWDGCSVGEIIVRGNVVTAGYWADPEATEQTIRDGWLHTGDLGTIDAEGYVLIVDRTKDVIKTGGENVSSIVVERVLYEHPAVRECAVVGVPDERWGEAVHAVVALHADHQVTEAELVRFCRDRLSGYEVPKGVDLVDDLPRGGTGKILKRALRERYRPSS